MGCGADVSLSHFLHLGELDWLLIAPVWECQIIPPSPGSRWGTISVHLSESGERLAQLPFIVSGILVLFEFLPGGTLSKCVRNELPGAWKFVSGGWQKLRAELGVSGSESRWDIDRARCSRLFLVCHLLSLVISPPGP